MLSIYIARICSDRNTIHPRKLLLSLGFSPQSVTMLLKGERARLDNKQMEHLCLSLRCTPNDLYTWQPDRKHVDEQQPIRTLARPVKPSISKLLSGINHERLEEIRELIEAKVTGPALPDAPAPPPETP